MTKYQTLQAQYRAMATAEAMANVDAILAAHGARKHTLAHRVSLWAERVFHRLTGI